MVCSPPVMSEIGRILPETYELMLQNSPFLFASRVTLQNTCVEDRWNECSFVTELLGTLFEDHPHYYLRSLDLARNSISTQGVFRLLIALKNYPRLASISLDENRIGDDFLESFRVFIQDTTIFPALRRISLVGNPFSEQTCQRLKDIFLTQYERSTVILC